MKRVSIAGVALLLLLAMAGCGVCYVVITEASESLEVIADPVPPTLGFASLEELIEAYKLLRTHKADRKLKKSAKSVDFAKLEKLYLPTNIPEAYKLYWITIYKGGVWFKYLPEKYTGSEFEALFDNYSFYCSSLDTDSMDDIMQANHLTEKDLIEGKYWFTGSNSLVWVLDGKYMSIVLPTSTEVYSGDFSLIDYLGLDSVEDLAQFTRVEAIDLVGKERAP